jgi:acetoin utilization deacetylase AcuC-like enzyme
MRVLFNKKFLNHNIDSPIEGVYRIAHFPEYYEDEDTDGEAYIKLVHTQAYVDKVKAACCSQDTLAEVDLTSGSWEAAKSAVGLSVMASLQGDFAVVRPPGHHAFREKTHGFCFFNNIAIAAQNLVNKGQKVLIIDIDGHHGDGTQSIFYNTNKVFYTSIHQTFMFPFTGSSVEQGEGEGLGFTMNIPLLQGNGDKQFLKALDAIITAGHQFQPDVVAVSAGFDAYKNDRLLGLKLSQKGFYEAGFRIRRAFRNVFAVLEGGYHLELKECIDSFISGINVGSRPIKSTFDHDMSIG